MLLQLLSFDVHAATFAPLKVVEIKPDWAKGYSRLGTAHHGLSDLDNAIEAFEKGEHFAAIVASVQVHKPNFWLILLLENRCFTTMNMTLHCCGTCSQQLTDLWAVPQDQRYLH